MLTEPSGASTKAPYPWLPKTSSSALPVLGHGTVSCPAPTGGEGGSTGSLGALVGGWPPHVLWYHFR
jgi:hypothetical protein